MIDTPSNPSPAPASHADAPAVPVQHRTVINSDQPVVSVHFAPAPADDGRWFRLLNWLVDSGAWASVSDASRAALIVLARHARTSDGTSLPALEISMAQSGLSRSGWFKALKELSGEPHRLIARTSTGAWELFPGRPFAQRGVRPLQGSDAEKPQPASPQGRWGGRMSRLADDDESTGVDFRSTGVDHQSTGVDSESTRVDPLSDFRLKTTTSDETDGDVDAVARDLNLKAGFRRADAANLIARHGAGACGDALANALHLKATGKLRSSLKAYVHHCLNRGYGLFAEVAAAREKETLASRSKELGAKLAAAIRPILDPQTKQLLGQAFGSTEDTVRNGHVTEREITTTTPAELLQLLTERARALEIQKLPAWRRPK